MKCCYALLTFVDYIGSIHKLINIIIWKRCLIQNDNQIAFANKNDQYVRIKCSKNLPYVAQKVTTAVLLDCDAQKWPKKSPNIWSYFLKITCEQNNLEKLPNMGILPPQLIICHRTLLHSVQLN